MASKTTVASDLSRDLFAQQSGFFPTMLNIFQIYLENDKRLPFVVRRTTWGPEYGLVVVKIELNLKHGTYGNAWGYALPPLNGKQQNDYWGLPGSPKKVSCAGCYQWKLLTDLPPQWANMLQAGA